MAVGTQQYAITSTASLIAAAPAGVNTAPAGALWLQPDAANDIFIGGPGVTTSNGFKVKAGNAPFGPIPLYPGDTLYAVTASTATLGVLQT
jgi:hypothetical protein